jgi:hypothetical protein
MNRSNFIHGLLTVGAGFVVLPGAGRVWKAVIDQRAVLDPNMFDPNEYVGKWHFIMDWKTYPMNAGCEILCTLETSRELGITT